MKTAAKRVVGRPFVKGDERINRGGRPPAVLTQAMMSKLTPAVAARLLDVVIAAAEDGEQWAMAMLWDRMEGKSVARTESGGPGEFAEELEPDEVDQIRSALKVVRGRSKP